MGAKVLLYRLPGGYRFWHSLALFRHGGMERPEWAYATFRRHYDGVDFARKGKDFHVLELGPGDSLFTALIAHAHGASRVTLIDVAADASRDLALYRALAAFLEARGLPVPDLSAIDSMPALLSACGAHYATDGLASLRALPDASIDFAFSNAVLHGVHRDEFATTLCELRRVLRPDGACSHSIDLRDMMGAALNHLRFTERVWESDLFRRSGFYSNRFRFGEMLDLFRRAGFAPEPAEVNRWDRLPISRNRLAPPFDGYPDDDLRVATFSVLLRPI
jgi:SAM-dependent methyltransferase